MSLTFRLSSLYFAWYLASSAPAAMPTGGCFCLSLRSVAADIVVDNQNGRGRRWRHCGHKCIDAVCTVGSRDGGVCWHTALSFLSPIKREMHTPHRQDMPPLGGFEAIKYRRNLPLRGPGAYVILGGVTAVCGYGFYRVGKGNLERRELEREKVWARIHLLPVLMAERDREMRRGGEAGQ